MALEWKIEDNSDKILKAKNEAIDNALFDVGLQLSGEAADELENEPRRIDTALLRNSITFALGGENAAISNYYADVGDGCGAYSGNAPDDEKGKRTLYVGTNVEYAMYVHDGTWKMTANPFLKNAFDRNIDQVERYIKEHLQNA